MGKKDDKLGMSFSTARARLERDLLAKLAMDAGYVCMRCGGELRRENFSVDHKINWLNSETPKELFFDQGNIGFSHQHCNTEERVSRQRLHREKPEILAEKRRVFSEWYERNKSWYNILRNSRRRLQKTSAH